MIVDLCTPIAQFFHINRTRMNARTQNVHFMNDLYLYQILNSNIQLTWQNKITFQNERTSRKYVICETAADLFVHVCRVWPLRRFFLNFWTWDHRFNVWYVLLLQVIKMYNVNASIKWNLFAALIIDWEENDEIFPLIMNEKRIFGDEFHP